MSDAITSQLLDGVIIQTADGQEFRCQPLTISKVRRFQQLRDRARQTDPAKAEDADAALTELVQSFAEAVGVPALEDHIAPADVFTLLSHFFWCPTGARVKLPGTNGPSNGTPSGLTSPLLKAAESPAPT